MYVHLTQGTDLWRCVKRAPTCFSATPARVPKYGPLELRSNMYFAECQTSITQTRCNASYLCCTSGGPPAVPSTGPNSSPAAAAAAGDPGTADRQLAEPPCSFDDVDWSEPYTFKELQAFADVDSPYAGTGRLRLVEAPAAVAQTFDLCVCVSGVCALNTRHVKAHMLGLQRLQYLCGACHKLKVLLPCICCCSGPGQPQWAAQQCSNTGQQAAAACSCRQADCQSAADAAVL